MAHLEPRSLPAKTPAMVSARAGLVALRVAGTKAMASEVLWGRGASSGPTAAAVNEGCQPGRSIIGYGQAGGLKPCNSSWFLLKVTRDSLMQRSSDRKLECSEQRIRAWASGTTHRSTDEARLCKRAVLLPRFAPNIPGGAGRTPWRRVTSSECKKGAQLCGFKESC